MSNVLDLFTSLLNYIIEHPSSKGSVEEIAALITKNPQHTLLFQIRLSQRVLYKKGQESKIILFYVLHEVLKRCQGKVRKTWFSTIEEILHGLVRGPSKERKRLVKVVARWKELGWFSNHIPEWEKLVSGEKKPKVGPSRLPKTTISSEKQSSQRHLLSMDNRSETIYI